MKTQLLKTRSIPGRSIWTVSLAMILLFGAVISHAAGDEELRVNASSQGPDSQRKIIGSASISYDEFPALLTSGERGKPTRVAGQQKMSGSVSGTPNIEYWFYDVSVKLFSDFDHDGYFYGIDLTFDADTQYAVAEVYAVIYLSYQFGPWNEYSATENFTIFGASSQDKYFVESELISGYPTGQYDILIELFDAYDDTLVASIGPEQSSNLSLLPLEDAGRDTPIVTTIVIDSGGGGSLAWFTLLMLAGAAVISHRKGRRD